VPSKPYENHGGTGVGVRLLAQFLTNYAHESLLPSPEPAGVREGD
jgi:hypothetical protein